MINVILPKIRFLDQNVIYTYQTKIMEKFGIVEVFCTSKAPAFYNISHSKDENHFQACISLPQVPKHIEIVGIIEHDNVLCSFMLYNWLLSDLYTHFVY